MIYFIKLCYAWLLPPGLFILALLAFYMCNRKTVKFYKLFPVMLLIYVLSISAVSDRIIKPLEDFYPQPSVGELQDAQAIVILGGGACGDVPDFDGIGQIAAGAANRHIMGLRLYRALQVPVIVSGGPVFDQNGIESETAKRVLAACGVEEKKILPDAKSRNTAENAKFTKEICDRMGFKKVVLVTSAYHMPRSVLLFEREGIEVIPYPTDYMTNKHLVLDAFAFTPQAYNLNVTAIAMREYLGIAAAKAGLQ